MTTRQPVAHIVTLGCARNDTDSEQLAGQLLADGIGLTDDASQADIIVVNTCGFIDAAKKDSIDTILALDDVRRARPGVKLVAAGCMAQRYGDELAASLPELDAIVGFDGYPMIGDNLRAVLGGRHPSTPPPSAPWTPPRQRLDDGPYAPLKIASGCDRRCAFCAIPSFRGSYHSRPQDDIVAEAGWLVGQGVREIMLVSENTSSYGKDLDDRRQALPRLLRRLSEVDGLEWVRLSYLQPAEMTPGLLDVMTQTERILPYFDLSFQHASRLLLRRMRRFGDTESFLSLIGQIRHRCPSAGIRTNVIMGFPGETDEDVTTLHDFLQQAGFDAIGVFSYSDEEGTEAYHLDGHLPDDVIAERTRATSELVTWLMESRAADRIGEPVTVLVEDVGGVFTGRSAHQGPEVDGTTRLDWPDDVPPPKAGDLVDARITATDGVDLIAQTRSYNSSSFSGCNR